MTCSFRNLAALSALAVCAYDTVVHATDTTHDFARYKIILDRAPFGAMAGQAVEVAQPSFSARFTFIGTTKEDNKPLTAVVLDKEGNRVRFLVEGDTVGPISVVKIEKVDKAPAKLVLKQDLEVATLLMDSKATGSGAAPAPPIPPPQMAQPGPQPTTGIPQPGVRRIPFARGTTK